MADLKGEAKQKINEAGEAAAKVNNSLTVTNLLNIGHFCRRVVEAMAALFKYVDAIELN